MSGTLADCIFVIIPEFYDPDNGYELGAIWPGIGGTYGTDFYCGHDYELAIEWVNDLNKERGHTPEFATAVLEATSGIDKIHFYNA